MKNSILAKRLVRWFTYGIAFALIPQAASLLLHFFLGKLTFDAVSRSPELLFFSLMISATALGDLTEIGQLDVEDVTLRIISSALVIAVIMSAILYGAFLFATVADSVESNSATRIFWVSVCLAILTSLVATSGQIFLGRINK